MTLEREVEQLRRLVRQLGEEVEQLRAENARLQAENAQLQAENGRLREENARLREALEEVRGEKGSGASFVKANWDKKEKRLRKRRDPKHNQARRLEEPTRVEKHRLEACPDCGGALAGDRLHYRRQVIEMPEPQPVEVIEHQIEKGWCGSCQRWHWPTVEWRGVVIGQGRMGVRLAGLVGYLRAVLRLPVRTIQQYLEAVHRLTVSVGEISALCQRVTEQLAPVGEQLQAEARTSPVVHMEETGWREDGENGYIWCLVTDGPQPVRYYEYHKSRGQAVAAGLLGPSRGIWSAISTVATTAMRALINGAGYICCATYMTWARNMPMRLRW